MFGVAATDGKIERRTCRRLSTWSRDYLREVALADLGCAAVGVFMAAQVPSHDNVTSAYQVYGGLDDVIAMVQAHNVDTVAVTACPEMDGITLRRIAWDLERPARTCAFRPRCLSWRVCGRPSGRRSRPALDNLGAVPGSEAIDGRFGVRRYRCHK
jgi:hypothetical protein